MTLLKAMAIACSLYSKIPMPQFPWEKKEMQYMLIFFPWIGAVIGGCLSIWCWVCDSWAVGTLCYAAIGTAIPLLITGGFHMDGFLDTMDALHSYQSKERKLEILKDSHIGAFAVIMAGVYGLCYLGAFSEIQSRDMLLVVCGGFFLARALSGISVVTFQPVKKDGMLSLFAEQAQKRVVKMTLIAEGGLCAGWMIWQQPVAGIIVVASACLTFFYYWWKTKKEFGGITGDTAGYFVLLCEVVMVVVAAAMEKLVFA